MGVVGRAERLSPALDHRLHILVTQAGRGVIGLQRQRLGVVVQGILGATLTQPQPAQLQVGGGIRRVKRDDTLIASDGRLDVSLERPGFGESKQSFDHCP